MTRKINSSLTPKAIIVYCILVLVIGSCKKNNVPELSELNELDEWYTQNKSGKHISFNDMKPLWESVYINERDSQLTVYEVKLSNPKNVYQTLSNNKNEANLRNNIRLLIFKDKKNGQVLAGCYMSILDEAPDLQDLNDIHYKQLKVLNGKVMFFNMTGKLENGWEYNNGVITKRINGSSDGYYYGNENTLYGLLKGNKTN